MKDPYLNDYDAYLNSLQRFSAPKRNHLTTKCPKPRLHVPLAALAVVGSAFAALAFIPWSG